MPESPQDALCRGTLEYLLKCPCEHQRLDFKQVLNLGDTRGKAELAKDVLAIANSGGGHLIVGVKDVGRQVVGLSANDLGLLRDSKSVNDKLKPYCGEFIQVHLAIHEVDSDSTLGRVSLALLWIPPAKSKIPAQQDGTYSQGGLGGKPEFVFRKGDVLIRRADESVKVALPSELNEHEAAPYVLTSLPGDEFINPYDFAGTATREMFKGRHAEITSLLDNIQSGTHTAIFGLQRIGKTSLVEEALIEKIQLKPQLAGQVFFTKIDFQRTGTEFSTYGGILISLFRAVAEAGCAQDPSDIENQVSLSMRQLVGGKRELLLMFTRLIEGAAERVTGRLVIFLDEFSELCRVIEANQAILAKNPSRKVGHPRELLADVDLMQWFSSMVKSKAIKGKLVFLFALRPFVAEYDDKRNLQLLKLTKPIMLYHLDGRAARSLITEPILGQICVHTDAAGYLADLTNGHPYLLQFMLKELVDRSMRGSREITVNDVKSLESEMVKEGPGYDAQFRVLDSDYSVDYVLNPTRTRIGNGILALIAKIAHVSKEGWVEVNKIIEQLQLSHSIAPEETHALLAQLLRAKILEDKPSQLEHQVRMSIPLLRKRYIQQNMYLKHFQGLRSAR